MPRRFFILLALGLGSLSLAAQTAAPPEGIDLKAMVQDVDRRMTPDSYIAWFSMASTRPGAPDTRQEAVVYRKDERMLMVITQPRLMKGQAILRRSDDMWLYLPRSRTVTRIGAKEQSLGGEASNADLLRTELGRDYQVNLVGMEDVDGEECYHLRLKALKRSLAYDQVDYWIAREAGLPVKREYYSLSGKLLRTITFADRREFGGRLIPARTTITNQLNPGYATTITLVKTRENSPIPDARFTTAWLESGASLSE